jgi:hypothetical protein
MLKPGQKVGRKEPCPCGSGVKYKSCCYALDRAQGEASLIKKVKKTRAPRKPKVIKETEPATAEDIISKEALLVSASELEAVDVLHSISDPNVAVVAPGE